MKETLSRRDFVVGSAAVAAGLAAAVVPARAQESPNEKVVLGVMGVNGRGKDLAMAFAALPNAEIAYLCDVDSRAIDRAAAELAKRQTRPARGVGDFRRVLEDPAVDALVVAAPDHWHAPATLLACQAGKHVYVEKPASHNPREGELMVEAARKHRRVVQVGTQRRSMPGVMEAMGKVRGGAIGRPLFARGWYNNTRPSIGHGSPAPVPEWLDYRLWQGPAPQRDYRDNLIHYNWHWFWHWGTGELGNNGIHALDLCRWGLGVETPLTVTSGGGKYRWSDDQETPDTQVVTYDFGDRGITWEGRSWHPRGFEGSMFGAAFYGDQGSLVVDGGGYVVYDLKEKEVQRVPGPAADAPHLANFLECVRTGRRPNADIEEGHRSTMLCHLGNIAYRTGHVLRLNPETGQIRDDRRAEALWSRQYRRGWEPKV